MRTRATIASILASGAVLLGGWQLGTAGMPTTTTSTTAGTGASSGIGASTGTTSGTGTDASPSQTATPTPSAAAPNSATDGTYTGSVESTRFGDVQVQITVSGGAITDVVALHLTDHDGRSVSISNRAAPILREEVIAAQSSQVQTVSGATYTTDGYLSSVQSAIDQAGL
ncbi:FMN-binding protein [Plantibacter flavus]|uniref:FMN-binding protein n=1 Tax=Plantibacter flavus TaxID=150123 RepID=UPI003F13DB03